MDVQINTANNIEGREALSQHLEGAVRDRLSRFEDRLTRVEMHVGDENGDRDSGHDKRCVVEARPAGLQPVSVTEQADSIEQATSGALGKMVSALDRTFGKLSDRKGH
ncbi:HPF/RaiA family ribosome-associated protein [Phenylobacterium sp.]|uniref:HPF/RaiA family ribosome-associated protein n=1 Tax=Phenylobacterium sp. TaxID=1871053 RepID=UPI0030F4075A